MSRSMLASRYLVLVAVAALAGGWSLFDQAGPEVRQDPATAGSRPSLCAPGLVEPASEVIELRSLVAGRLDEVRVEPGQGIARGDVLAAVDRDRLEAAVAIRGAELAGSRARLSLLEAGSRAEEVEAARARLASVTEEAAAADARRREVEAGPRAEDLAALRARVEELEAARDEARRNLERHRRLVPSGAMEEARIEGDETALAVAGARVRHALAELARLEAGARPEETERARAERLAAAGRVREAAANLSRLEAGSRPEEIEAARAEVAAAEGRLAAARVDLEDAIVRSPLDGLVVYRHRHPGELVGPEDEVPLLEVATASPLHVRADVDEFDVARVREGQAVEVTAPAFGERRFAGRVVRIERTLGRRNFRTELATEKKDAKILEVVVALEGPAEGVLPLGMPVRVWFLGE